MFGDYVHVDLADAHILALEIPKAGTFDNVRLTGVSSADFSNEQMLDATRIVTGKPLTSWHHAVNNLRLNDRTH